MSFLKTLFKYRLLPARFSGLLSSKYEVREDIFFGFASTFDHVAPELDAYLTKMGVVYRVKHFTSNFRYLLFWSKRDYEIFLDAADPLKNVIRIEWEIRQRSVAGSKFEAILAELDIDYIKRERSYATHYTIISTKRMIELMLRLDFEVDHHGYRTLVSV
jgi:hypothetical protein